MLYLIAQISLFLILAAALGLGVGWVLRGARRGQRDRARERQLEKRLKAARLESAMLRVDLNATQETLRTLETLLATPGRQGDPESGGGAPVPAAGTPPTAAPGTVAAAQGTEVIPVTPASRDYAGDDLTVIRGISASIERRLRRIGVETFEQVGSWDDDEVEQMAARIGTSAEAIRREGWVETARALHQRIYLRQ